MSFTVTEPDQTIPLPNQYANGCHIVVEYNGLCLTYVSVCRWGKNKRRKHGTLECNKVKLSLRACDDGEEWTSSCTYCHLGIRWRKSEQFHVPVTCFWGKNPGSHCLGR
jgi:hypothetical protein